MTITEKTTPLEMVLGVWIFSFLPADFILIMMDNHFITSGTLIQKQRCIAMSEETKIKRTKKEALK